jgi:hypothetical protein
LLKLSLVITLLLHPPSPILICLIGTSGADADRPLKEIFEDFEKQENENLNDNYKKNLIKELNEMHTAGLSTPDFFTTDLRETRKSNL